MSPILVVVITAAFFGAIFYYTRSQRERLAARRQANALPELGGGQVGSIDGNAVRVVGTVRALVAIPSPISGRQCVAYRVQVKLDRYEIPDAPHIDEARSVEFMIDRPGEPSVIVDGSHVRLDVKPLPGDSYDGAMAERFLAQRGLPIRAALGSEFSEMMVPVGAKVMVAGTVVLDGAGAGPQGGMMFTGASGNASHVYRETGAPTIRLTGNAQQPLVIAVVD